MKKSYLLVSACLFLTFPSFAQNIAINTDASLPDANAILDIKSGNKGLLIPRMDSMARNAIPNTKGLLVYDISTDNFWYNTGKGWQCIPSDGDGGKNGNAWLLKGNGNASDPGSFLGTTNNVALNIRVNNQPSGRIDSASGSAFWGYHAGGSNTGGLFNTANGFRSLFSNTTGSDNTAIGANALTSNTTGVRNMAIGSQALISNNTGTGNSASGFEALYANTTGGGNTATGADALESNTVGSDNTGSGTEALARNTTGIQNTGTGGASLVSNTTGSSNTGTGTAALDGNTTGNNNTGTGAFSLLANTTGNNNTVDGYFTFNSNITGSNNTAIGSQADVSTGNLNNATALGAGAIVDASNKVRIGNSAVTVIEGQVPFTTPSDGRYKFNVQEDVKGLDFILHLRPVTYQFDVKRFDAQMAHTAGNGNGSANYAMLAAYDEATRIRRSGFIAQEVERAAVASGYDFSGIIRPKTSEDHYSLSYDAFVVPLVKAVQEQQLIIVEQGKKVQEQDKKIEEQDKRIAALESRLQELMKLLQGSK